MEPPRWTSNYDRIPVVSGAQALRLEPSVSDKGLDVANQNRASGEEGEMFLTCPYIDQAFALKTLLDGANE